jgi:hypothetical protein
MFRAAMRLLNRREEIGAAYRRAQVLLVQETNAVIGAHGAAGRTQHSETAGPLRLVAARSLRNRARS